MATKAPPTKKVPVKKSAPTKAAPTKAARSRPAEQTPAEKYTIKHLQDDVAAALPLASRATLDRTITAAFEAMTAAFLSGKVVTIKDFGKIEIRRREERIGRNPKTGESITIPAKTVPKFTFAKALKEGAQ